MVIDHHSFAPAIAEFLDLESLVQVRSLTTESTTHYQYHLMEARKIERLKREEKAREEEEARRKKEEEE